MYGNVDIRKNRGITSNPNLIECEKSITTPTMSGPKTAQILPKIENTQKADN